MKDGETHIIEPVSDRADNSAPDTDMTRFTIVPHLLFLGLLLIILFSAAIVPSLANLLPENTSAATAQPLLETVIEKPNPAMSNIADLTLQAKSVFVWDVATQRVLLQKEADQVLPLASITKLMTALLAYELLDEEATVTISGQAADLPSGGSIAAGEVFNARQLADFALISSFNTAAYGLGGAVGSLLGSGDPQQQFIAAMNLRAVELGFLSMKYYNPTGLDESMSLAGGYGTARDISFLVEYILNNYPEILLPTITSDIKLYNTAGDFHTGNNTNDYVSDIPGLLGSKTGFTDLAGGNLTIVFDAGFNRPIIVTVLNSTRSGRYDDVLQIVEAVKADLSN